MNNLDYKYIEQLINRYFNAETTLQEEQILKSFYAQNDAEMPQELRSYAPLFEALNADEQLDESFDERLLAHTQEQPVVKARVISIGQRLRPLFSAAAVVAILLTLANAMNVQLKTETATTEDIVVADYDAPIPSEQPTMAFDQETHRALPADTVRIDTLKSFF